jgi:hypothetical protein
MKPSTITIIVMAIVIAFGLGYFFRGSVGVSSGPAPSMPTASIVMDRPMRHCMSSAATQQECACIRSNMPSDEFNQYMDIVHSNAIELPNVDARVTQTELALSTSQDFFRHTRAAADARQALRTCQLDDELARFNNLQ